MSERRTTPLNQEPIEPHSCSVELRLEILQQLPFFSSLSERQVAEVNGYFREHGFLAGEVVYLMGEPATRFYVVAAGQMKLMRHTLGGQDVLLEILTPGDFFGSLAALGDDVYADTAEAQTAVCVLGISAADFRALLERYPAVSLAALDVVSARLRAAHEMVRRLSAQPVEQRLAYTLLQLADKLGEEQEEGTLIQMPLSRADLAGMVGTTVETASRLMSQFQKDGLVNSGRRWVAVANRERLAAVAAVN